ncbi:MAG: menaquinone biosynthesis protein [Parachlamydiales bacterium]
MRVGIPKYSNTIPLIGGLLAGEVESDIEWVREVPTTLNRLISVGELDIGLISTAHYLENQSALKLLSGHCIAAVDEVQSVLLYKRNGIEKIDKVSVAITDESASGARLLKVLAERFWNVAPHYVKLCRLEEATEFPAFLLIGDAALENPVIPGYYTVDLATAWYEKTGLPFPFAVFAAPKVTPEVDRAMQQIKASYEWGRRNESALIDLAKRSSPLSREQLKGYFRLLHYRLEEEEMAGLRTFAALIEIPSDALV